MRMIEDKPNDEIKEIDGTKGFYLCSPLLNTECMKENCYINNGPCCHTVNKEHSQQHLLDSITNLRRENERFRTQLNAYENPDDLTLFYMWLDEKAKDKMKELQQENEYLKKNQRFHKKFGSDYIFCLEGDKETYKDMVLEKQEEIEQLQQAVKESITLLWKSDISTSKGLEIINILRSCLKSE